MKSQSGLYTLVFLGGALGSLLRFGVGQFFDNLTTLVFVNLLGAAFLGWANGSGRRGLRGFASPGAQAFWGAGFAGGFTTMSGLAFAFVMLSASFPITVALAYLIGQFGFGLLAYWGGLRLGSLDGRKREPGDESGTEPPSEQEAVKE